MGQVEEIEGIGIPSEFLINGSESLTVYFSRSSGKKNKVRSDWSRHVTPSPPRDQSPTEIHDTNGSEA